MRPAGPVGLPTKRRTYILGGGGPRGRQKAYSADYPASWPGGTMAGARFRGQHWAEVGDLAGSDPTAYLDAEDLGETLIVRAPPSPYTLAIVAVAAVGLFWVFFGGRGR